MHGPAKAVIVVDRVVLGAAIVPKRERAQLPAKAAGKLGPGLMREQKAEQRRAFFLGHVPEAHGMAAVDVKRLSAGLGMGAHDRMQRLICGAGILAGAIADAVLAGLGD